MSEDNMKDPAAGASGMVYDDTDKPEAPAKKKRGRPRKTDPAVSILEKRVEELETRIAASVPKTHQCHMCHKGGANIERGNTGEWFHPCLQAYRRGEDPTPLEE